MSAAATVRRASRSAAALCLILTAGCATVQLEQAAAATVDPYFSAPNQIPTVEDGTSAPPALAPAAVVQAITLNPPPAVAVLPAAAAEDTVTAAPPAVPAPSAASGATHKANTTPAAPASNQTVTRAPTTQAPAKAIASAPGIDPKKHESPPPVAKKVEPQLDVAALKARLRDTSAIGVFTKLALKNQVDDLMQQFRAHYLSGHKTSPAALRQPYDMLILKVLALIQDSDPSLAKTISGSREAIWGILADPQKFDAAS